MLQRGPGAIASRMTRLRRPPAACSVCGSEYQPNLHRRQKVCSSRCAVILQTVNPVVPCPHCGAMFTLKYSGRQFCSRDCYRASHLSARTKTCQHCGVKFFHARAKSDQRHCSVACEGAARAASHTHCKRGHERTPENTYIKPSTGYRTCLACVEHQRRARGVAVGLDTEARAARLARWEELGKTYDAVAVLAAEYGVTKHAIKEWLKRHGDPVPNGHDFHAAQSGQLTHCKHGHEFTPQNPRVDSKGRRTCGACRAASAVKYYEANRDRLKAAAAKRARVSRAEISANNKAKTHCSNGHEYNAENTSYVRSGVRSGWRICRICSRMRAELRAEMQTHCKNGHERTPENTRVIASGSSAGRRQCVICTQEAKVRYKAAQLVDKNQPGTGVQVQLTQRASNA
jgi:hypothetical protein